MPFVIIQVNLTDTLWFSSRISGNIQENVFSETVRRRKCAEWMDLFTVFLLFNHLDLVLNIYFLLAMKVRLVFKQGTICNAEVVQRLPQLSSHVKLLRLVLYLLMSCCVCSKAENVWLMTSCFGQENTDTATSFYSKYATCSFSCELKIIWMWTIK